MMFHNCCRLRRLAVAGLFLAGPFVSLAHGDGGTLRISQKLEAYDVAVFTDPAPLRAGPVDVSVWAQETNSSRLADVQIMVTAKNNATQQLVRAPATREAATNKLLQAARFELPAAGIWQFDIEVLRRNDAEPSAEGETVSFTADVAERLPRWRELAGWIFWPVVPIGLFGTHLYLVGRAKRPAKPSADYSA